ncbi:autoimmune regulator-like [Cuculus canorus]|uniref:autoimmune regulator-like n=1 Tax=Cuculus canorus TaxID=55661 RepID=UPI0023AA3E40|nr:autoimmune regulator-like [Cuculus canorus]
MLCVSCAGTPDTGSLASSAAGSDHPLQAAKAEDGPLGGEPVLSRDELDALLGEGAWDGILQWAFQSVARPLADTHGLLA